MDYEVVIGMEVHVELFTRTKMFCGCPNRFSPEPNVNICEGCLGFPGTLPLLNRESVEQGLRASLALSCEIALYSRFDRKNYFYPDIPKGYQISQYYIPLGSRGYVDIKDEQGAIRRINITRVHLEEDAGKLVHASGGGSRVDYNRAGVPLVEIVTDPDLRSPFQARRYLELLKSFLQYARVSDCKMEEGSLRCDANISIRPRGSSELGAKTELKNMNSFRSVERALEFEVKRQLQLLDRGKPVIPETRRWDEEREETIAMRSKLEAHDYRCFVDPELAPIELSPAQVREVKESLPEMAPSRISRYVSQYALPEYDAEVLTSSIELSNYFEECLKYFSRPKIVSNWIMGDFLAHVKQAECAVEEVKITPRHLAHLLELVEEGTISGKIAKTVFETSFKTGKSPREIVEEEGLLQISDETELEKLADRILAGNPASVEDYRGGKTKALSFLVGQVMKETQGKANPQMVNELLRKKIEQ